MNESVDTLNTRLTTLYGRSPDGRPIYRLVYSTTQLEKRWGEFEDYYGKIFLRRFSGVREVPKYPYCKDRWVLEVLLPVYNPEIYQSDLYGSYEPLWVFQDKNGNFLQPIWKAVELIIVWNHNKPEKKNDVQIESEHQAQLEREEAEEFEKIDNQVPYIADKLHEGEAITVPKEYDNGGNKD